MKQVNWIVILLVLVLVACSSEPQMGEPADTTLTSSDFGTSGSDSANGVTAPKNGVGAVVVGHTTGSLDGVNKGSLDAFIRKYDGGVLWAQQFGTRNPDIATDGAVTQNGIRYVIGRTGGALGFKLGLDDVFLRKYDAQGVLQWTRQFGTPGSDEPVDVALDSSNNVYVLSEDSNAMVIRKFAANGALLRTITNTDPNIENCTALGVDSAGNILALTSYITGSKDVAKLFRYNSSGTLLNSPTVYDPAGSLSVFDLMVDNSDNLTISVLDGGRGMIRQLSNTGANLRTLQIEPTPTSQSLPRALAFDKDNNIYVAGDTNAAYQGFFNKGGLDVFVLKFSPTGAFVWVRQFGGNSTDLGLGIAVSDAVYVAGSSRSNPNMVGDTAYGDIDAYLAQLELATGNLMGIDQ